MIASVVCAVAPIPTSILGFVVGLALTKRRPEGVGQHLVAGFGSTLWPSLVVVPIAGTVSRFAALLPFPLGAPVAMAPWIGMAVLLVNWPLRWIEWSNHVLGTPWESLLSSPGRMNSAVIALRMLGAYMALIGFLQLLLVQK